MSDEEEIAVVSTEPTTLAKRDCDGSERSFVSSFIPHPSSLRILLWDIDGTLIRTARAGAFKDYEREMNDGSRIHPAFRGVNHPVNVNLGTIEGGEWNSSVATRCRIGLRRIGRRDHDRSARVATLAHALVERYFAQERHPNALGQPAAASFAEDVGASAAAGA